MFIARTKIKNFDLKSRTILNPAVHGFLYIQSTGSHGNAKSFNPRAFNLSCLFVCATSLNNTVNNNCQKIIKTELKMRPYGIANSTYTQYLPYILYFDHMFLRHISYKLYDFKWSRLEALLKQIFSKYSKLNSKILTGFQRISNGFGEISDVFELKNTRKRLPKTLNLMKIFKIDSK